MAITLYGGPQTRASMPRWYMEEMGIPYELVELSLANGQNLKDNFLNQKKNNFLKHNIFISTIDF